MFEIAGFYGWMLGTPLRACNMMTGKTPVRFASKALVKEKYLHYNLKP